MCCPCTSGSIHACHAILMLTAALLKSSLVTTKFSLPLTLLLIGREDKVVCIKPHARLGIFWSSFVIFGHVPLHDICISWTLCLVGRLISPQETAISCQAQQSKGAFDPIFLGLLFVVIYKLVFAVQAASIRSPTYASRYGITRLAGNRRRGWIEGSRSRYWESAAFVSWNIMAHKLETTGTE